MKASSGSAECPTRMSTGVSLVPPPVPLSRFWVASTKPGPRSLAAKAKCLGKSEGGPRLRVIAGQNATTSAGGGTL
jgi:hypothetical protein